MEAQALLRELGRRLRAEREAAGLSLSDMARRAGVSRRYATSAEAGRANLSFVKLAALAEALDVPLGRLCDLPAGPRRSERIALVGLRGAGKSTLGRRLALQLEVPFVELDHRIEALAGMPLGEIFDLHGSETFHELEGDALEAVLCEADRLVIAPGGSIVRSPRNFARLQATCRTVWLSARPEEHLERVRRQGDRRPMKDRPRAKDEIEALLAERRALYARCSLHLDTSGLGVEQALAALTALLARDDSR